MPKKSPLRIRVKELRHVAAAELNENPQNWRRHPKKQREALRQLLNEIGFAGAVLAREQADGSLEVLDGHLRADLAKNEEIPVLILDLNDAEAKTFLMSYDPIGALATTDPEVLKTMLEQATIPDDLMAYLQDEMLDAQIESTVSGGGNPLAETQTFEDAKPKGKEEGGEGEGSEGEGDPDPTVELTPCPTCGRPLPSDWAPEKVDEILRKKEVKL